MPPRGHGGRAGKSHARPEPAPPQGPHAGQASIRKAYEALGVQAFYASHGSRYTNPHEVQIAAAIDQLMDNVPAAVWLGLAEPPAGLAAKLGQSGEGGEDADSDGEDEEPCDGSSGNQHHLLHGRGGCGGSRSSAAFTPPPPPSASAAAAIATAVTAGLVAPVPLRVLDLAAGSGEVTAALTEWNEARHMPPATGSATATTPGAIRPPQPQQQQQSQGGGSQARGGRAKSTAPPPPPAVLPYSMHITACDPYTYAAYEARTGRVAQRWSFEDIADGLLADWEHPDEGDTHCLLPRVVTAVATTATAAAATSSSSPLPPPRPASPSPPSSAALTLPAAMTTASPLPSSAAPPVPPPVSTPPAPLFDVCLCSFALHLAPPSRLHTTLAALGRAARWLVLLAPHKRPHVGPGDGWGEVAGWRLGRTHVRLYRSLTAGPAEVAEG